MRVCILQFNKSMSLTLMLVLLCSGFGRYAALIQLLNGSISARSLSLECQRRASGKHWYKHEEVRQDKNRTKTSSFIFSPVSNYQVSCSIHSVVCTNSQFQSNITLAVQILQRRRRHWTLS